MVGRWLEQRSLILIDCLRRLTALCGSVSEGALNMERWIEASGAGSLATENDSKSPAYGYGSGLSFRRKKRRECTCVLAERSHDVHISIRYI